MKVRYLPQDTYDINFEWLEKRIMEARPMRLLNQFLGKTIKGFNSDGFLLWEDNIKAIQKAGKTYRDGYYHFWLSNGQVTGTINDIKRWTE